MMSNTKTQISLVSKKGKLLKPETIARRKLKAARSETVRVNKELKSKALAYKQARDCFEKINKMGKWEDYVEMQLENGDSTMEEIYTQFSWGHDNAISYGKYLILCIGEFDTKNEWI